MVIAEIPNIIKKSDTDYVSYRSGFDAATELESKRPCYANLMGDLTKRVIRCIPNTGATPVDSKTFLKWMALCQLNGLVPPTALYWSSDDKNYLEIQKGGDCRHGTYAGLCCYRFSESFAPMVWQIVEHHKTMPNVSFWQLLHYGLITHYTIGTGHSFCELSAVYCPKPNNLAVSVALFQLFSRYHGHRKKFSEGFKSNSVYGNSNYYNEGTTIFLVDRITNGLPKLNVGDKKPYKEVLDPKYSVLYVNLNATKDELAEIFKGIH